MFEITRKEAVDMLVSEELENLTSYALLGLYEDTVRDGARGYNEFSDAELASQFEFVFNKIEGVRII